MSTFNSHTVHHHFRITGLSSSFRNQKLRNIFVILCLVLFLGSNISKALSQAPAADWRQVRSIYTREFEAPHPQGLAFSPAANTFLLLPNQASASPAELVMITMYEEPGGSLRLSMPITDPLNLTYDSKANSLLVYDPAADELIEIRSGPAGIPDPLSTALTRYNVRQFGMQQARGMAIDPESGRLYILNAKAQRVTRVAPHPTSRFDGGAAEREGRIQHISLRALKAVDLRAIAYSPSSQHMYVLDAGKQVLYELAEDGKLVAERDLLELGLQNPQGMVIAPSVDRTDDPAIMDLFILDSAEASPEGTTLESSASEGALTTAKSGRIIEISFESTAGLPPGIPLLPSTLVRTVDISKNAWNPSSPDPAGITYWPMLGRFLVVDSEVEEMPSYWKGVNVFGATTSGSLVSTCTTYTTTKVPGTWNDYSKEPTGVAINPNNNFIYIADDSGGGKLHEVKPGPDGAYCTSDDIVTTISFATDLEDVAYGNNKLFIAGGVDAEVWMWDLGPNGVLGGGDDGPVMHFDTASLGFTDLEGVAYNWENGNLFLISTINAEKYLGEVTTSGTLLRAYDLGFMGTGPGRRSGLTYAPGSPNLPVRHIYIVSRGVDNGADPLENDGMWWEISLGSSQSPPTTTPTPGSTSTPTLSPTPGLSPTPTRTPTVTNTPLPTLTPSPVDNFLLNPGFELDVNNDGWPDSWTPEITFSQSSAFFRSGNYSGRYFSTSNASGNVRQQIDNLTPGKVYSISGWVNIPQPAGSTLSFQPKIEWRNGTTLIYRDSLKKYTGVTNGWDQFTGTLVAPAGTTNARLVLALTGLNGTIYLDDFVFGVQEPVSGETPTSTNTPLDTQTTTSTPTSSFTPTSTLTPTPGFTPTSTPMPTPTLTNTPTQPASPSETVTPVVVTRIDPDSMKIGTVISATISGSGFLPGGSVAFINGQGSSPAATDIVVLDSNRITLTITMKNSGPSRIRVWDVQVTNPDGSVGVLVNGFTVNP